MRNLFFILLFWGVWSCQAQNIIGNNINIGTTDSLQSKILHEKQHFWISLPTSFYNPKMAKVRYPVIYVLDGDANFASVSTMAKQLSIRNGNTVMPEAIVVGVMNNSRDRDFTPYPSSYWVYKTPSPLENTGGGEQFVKYLQQELIPHIDSIYPTEPYKVLVGHSLGGLAATNIFVNHTKLFNAYILIDPSMWYDHQGFLKRSAKSLSGKRLDGTTVFLAIANTMEPEFNLSTISRDTSGNTLHIRSILMLRKLLKEKAGDGLRFKAVYFQDDSHMSLPLPAEYNGFRFIFSYYQIPPQLDAAFLIPGSNEDPRKYLIKHYQDISAHMGYTVIPSESLVNMLANTMKDYYLPGKALSLYELNTSNYPQSFGAWLSLGEFYEGQKDNRNAIACYKRALALNALPEIRARLSKIEALQ